MEKYGIYSNPGLGQVTIISMEDESFHCFQPNYLGGRKQYLKILSPSTRMHDGKRQKNVKHAVFKKQQEQTLFKRSVTGFGRVLII